MSSQNSPVPTPEVGGHQLLESMTDVAENSLFAMVDVAEDATWRAAAESEEGAMLLAHVGFSGPFSGAIDVLLPAALAQELGAAFLGAESPEEVSPANAADFAGEFANMTCGAWLTRTHPKDAFSLSAPQVAVSPADEPAGAGSTALFLLVNDRPVRARLSLASGQDAR